jgi:hypothetical protein
VKAATRDALLWLAGVGGALAILRALLDLLSLLAAAVSPVLLGAAAVLLMAGALSLLVMRSKLEPSP